jgi:hypothetical protein
MCWGSAGTAVRHLAVVLGEDGDHRVVLELHDPVGEPDLESLGEVSVHLIPLVEDLDVVPDGEGHDSAIIAVRDAALDDLVDAEEDLVMLCLSLDLGGLLEKCLVLFICDVVPAAHWTPPATFQ